MGKIISSNEKLNYNSLKKTVKNVSLNCRIAIWQVPQNNKLPRYDTDNNRWLETFNKEGEDEIENAEQKLHLNFGKYKVITQATEYEDNSVCVISDYPNGNKVIEHRYPNSVCAQIKNKDNQIVAEKIFNTSSTDGRKVIYKHIKQGENIFTIIRIFSYDTRKNRQTDIVNYGYTSLESTLTNNCTLEREYYELNGKSVKVKKNKNFEYKLKDEKGKKLVFTED